MHERNRHAKATENSADAEKHDRQFGRKSPPGLPRCGSTLAGDLDIWLAEHESGRSQQDAVHASDQEVSFAPTGYRQQFLHGKRDEPLAERAAGGHNTQSKAAALLEPSSHRRKHGAIQTPESERADEQVEQLDIKQVRLSGE